MTITFPTATITGYPRIGPKREQKKALESYWAGHIDAEVFAQSVHTLRLSTYHRLRELGLDEDYSIPASYSHYDHVLDTALTVGLIDSETAGTDFDLDEYFALARGTAQRPPLEMTKWFDTNYHYLVPEIEDSTQFRAHPQHLLSLVSEARAAGHTIRPVLVGPVTLLALAKSAPGTTTSAFTRLDELTAVYRDVISILAAAGVDWVQLDEPALVTDCTEHTDEQLAEAASRAYTALAGASTHPQILVTAPYGSLRAGLPALANSGIDALGVDVSAATRTIDPGYVDRIAAEVPAPVHLVAGVIDGRNVWADDLRSSLAVLGDFCRESLSVSTSTSLLHVPHTVSDEPSLPVDVASWLSFAEEKVTEVAALASALEEGAESCAESFACADRAKRTRTESARVHSAEVAARTAAVSGDDGLRIDFETRAAAQSSLDVPRLPTTTIGSFPQTAEVRRARADHRGGRLEAGEYSAAMRVEIDRVVWLQEELGLDVIVHGEPERNDMVQYFAENLDGFATTDNGWVQSYGSRCTRPPILFGDVSRPEAFTVEWSTYAATRTQRPVKGMLTGPVTILAWSFVRDDVPLAQSADQIALALADEVADLEAAGIGIIQVDEPALRELLPLRDDDRPDYLEWSVRAFRLVNAKVDPSTQIHTHLCYSEFGQIIEAINALDADVTSIEAARSRMEVLADIADFDFTRGIGPGIYDIHSPRVPTVAELTELIEAALADVGADRLWINPDCGLKTRSYAEVRRALANLVAARDAVLGSEHVPA
ncbi:5-methyltetrahydropteroyltriglutamate--homocysteine S-methyltransferase [Brevibacterium sp.]|uniref:5-methyltetrahydropteroyltriglutamate-- homocysteine S-methyltransferase n=1 Tax=Brevibacterium sp. TaxID=1701 RepID=UPI00264921E9|nr:5-methyltetrahydropteroyltriglutamate--homocysteine S-methyltransferase [Brevibacterium sp.]MDN5805953.1 5-methyltetrahydropteroyltriglutamate--homocysteine S-methyltransferase [Brevibacterium sp.]MDN5834474.1 5-methyltetrahydropteroyltriglutamate--homocysteine S-methyltransferase [Brevibacterium sp.]MDN5877112.1 5-methyltetrahydropteroyltriglutamate--homocysteine S-methyltransferase [Brevibacterium sp.]MDN5909667.1 5-methyltetrahydropteroyltriglutamate--homocysteine S-methyltransferase [Bre